MAVVAPPNTSNIALPPPTQNPPTLVDVGQAQKYLDTLTRLRTSINLTVNSPTDSQIGAATKYVEEVASKCAPVAAPPWLAQITTRIDNLNNNVNNRFTALTDTVNARFDRVERQIKILQNTTRGAGNVISYDSIFNNNGDPLPLRPITNSHDLVNLSNPDLSTWYAYYFPDRNQVGVAIAVKKVDIARYIGTPTSSFVPDIPPVIESNNDSNSNSPDLLSENSTPASVVISLPSLIPLPTCPRSTYLSSDDMSPNTSGSRWVDMGSKKDGCQLLISHPGLEALEKLWSYVTLNLDLCSIMDEPTMNELVRCFIKWNNLYRLITGLGAERPFFDTIRDAILGLDWARIHDTKKDSYEMKAVAQGFIKFCTWMEDHNCSLRGTQYHKSDEVLKYQNYFYAQWKEKCMAVEKRRPPGPILIPPQQTSSNPSRNKKNGCYDLYAGHRGDKCPTNGPSPLTVPFRPLTDDDVRLAKKLHHAEPSKAIPYNFLLKQVSNQTSQHVAAVQPRERMITMPDFDQPASAPNNGGRKSVERVTVAETAVVGNQEVSALLSLNKNGNK
ncbi:hypothetical protein BT96DRAFT_1026458 [Gymnopus androsaceus JB14]|uniref:Mug135-like C-terminal domain-containing protein n=1 Tax=Gymnopus androsaceus JB14 TaxID=1447944 RepID=A0A6A4GJE4_9AGAR|nr:hypothetical protein BT96DRAFT_1026458 [Gymnopus androsaceus JB14]